MQNLLAPFDKASRTEQDLRCQMSSVNSAAASSSDAAPLREPDSTGDGAATLESGRESMWRLVAMGFSREEAALALLRSNTEAEAVEHLLAKVVAERDSAAALLHRIEMEQMEATARDRGHRDASQPAPSFWWCASCSVDLHEIYYSPGEETDSTLGTLWKVVEAAPEKSAAQLTDLSTALQGSRGEVLRQMATVQDAFDLAHRETMAHGANPSLLDSSRGARTPIVRGDCRVVGAEEEPLRS